MEEEDQNDWIFDAIYEYFKSASWQSPVQSFIECNCVYFLANDSQNLDQQKLAEQSEIHSKFRKLIDSLMSKLLNEIGITQQEFVKACEQAKNNKKQWSIVKQILLVEKFEEFKKLMVLRNQKLEREALQMMLQNEDRRLKKLIQNPNMSAQDKVNKLNKNDESSSSSEEDEVTQLAIRLSKEQEEKDKKRWMKQAGEKHSEYQGNFDEKDGLERAIKLSKQESGIQDDEQEEEEEEESEQEEFPNADSKFRDLMSDTAGFQKILELSKKEDDHRKETMKKFQNLNEQDLINKAIQMSEYDHHTLKNYNEEEVLNQILQKSKEEAQNKDELEKKNDELLKIMQQIEENKPEGWEKWGFAPKKVISEENNLDQQQLFEQYQHNLEKAIKKIEIQQKIKKYDSVQQNNQSDQILNETKINNDESLEERRAKLKEQKEKLILERHEERKEELMRASFYNAGQQNQNKFLNAPSDPEMKKLDLELKKRQQKQDKGEKEEDKNQNIEDQYEGFGTIKKIENLENKSVLDDGFLGELKKVDVPDSDDECYF